MTTNFDVMSDNLRRYDFVNRDDVILKLTQFSFLYKTYLLVKFHDNRRSRTFSIKINRPSTENDDYDVIIQQHKVDYTLNLAES